MGRDPESCKDGFQIQGSGSGGVSVARRALPGQASLGTTETGKEKKGLPCIHVGVRAVAGGGAQQQSAVIFCDKAWTGGL